MIERVARKLCEQEAGDPDAIRIGEGKAAGRTWLGWEAHASQGRALLSVTRQPTEAMVRKAEAAYDAIFPEDQPLADYIWQFMIDAALTEGAEAIMNDDLSALSWRLRFPRRSR
jgi:hypothetical protein